MYIYFDKPIEVLSKIKSFIFYYELLYLIIQIIIVYTVQHNKCIRYSILTVYHTLY